MTTVVKLTEGAERTTKRNVQDQDGEELNPPPLPLM